jgi:LmbE family N-acetylglucosaminyl deacetylase
MVFSPHPDDETIALGGLLRRLTHARAPLRVVFLTSGDGYPEAAQAQFDDPTPGAIEYRALGRLREDEARAAAARVGLAPQGLGFLGFPDDGLAPLWNGYWADRYSSPRTGGSGSGGVEFRGRNLSALIERELAAFQPTVVIMPHPADTHLDHAHASYFAAEAVHALQARRELRSDLLVLTYVVHHPAWPHRRPPDGDRLLPIPLPATSWQVIELSDAELEAKRAAVGEYRSQLAVMRGFLLSFVGRNELLARVDPQVLDRIAAIH